jgi:hypothetical protein
VEVALPLAVAFDADMARSEDEQRQVEVALPLAVAFDVDLA